MTPNIQPEKYQDVCRFALREIYGKIPSWINEDEAVKAMVKSFPRNWADFRADILDEFPDAPYDFASEIGVLFPCSMNEKEYLDIDISQFYHE